MVGIEDFGDTTVEAFNHGIGMPLVVEGRGLMR